MFNGGTSKRFTYINIRILQRRVKLERIFIHINRWLISISDINRSKSTKEKVVTSINIDDLPIEIDNDFLSITIDS